MTQWQNETEHDNCVKNFENVNLINQYIIATSADISYLLFEKQFLLHCCGKILQKREETYKTSKTGSSVYKGTLSRS